MFLKKLGIIRCTGSLRRQTQTQSTSNVLLMEFKACPLPGFGEGELKADHLLAPLKGPSMASCEIGDEAFARAPQKPFNRAQGSYLPPPRYIDNLTHAVFTGGSVPDYLTEAKQVKRRENDTFSSQPGAPSHDGLSPLRSLSTARCNETMQRVPDSVVLQCSVSKRSLVGSQGVLQENKEGKAAGRERRWLHPGPTSSYSIITRR